MRISDWSSDVCSSDLACPASSPRRSRCRRSQSPVSSSALSRPPGIPTLRLRILRDSGKVSREALLGLDLHAAQDLDALRLRGARAVERSEEHTSELQSLMRNSYAVFCLKKKTKKKVKTTK